MRVVLNLGTLMSRLQSLAGVFDVDRQGRISEHGQEPSRSY